MFISVGFFLLYLFIYFFLGGGGWGGGCFRVGFFLSFFVKGSVVGILVLKC